MEHDEQKHKENKLIRIFDRQAKTYEKRRKKQQLAKLRQKLLEGVYGQVLEVSVGAGANFPYYPSSGVHVTAVDFSPKMIEKARLAAAEFKIPSEFIVSNVENLHFDANSFDCIVSTLSFCGYENPLDLLLQFRKWCKPQGKIMLFEHGKSSFTPFAWAQNRFDGLSVKLIGCHANRDILDLVRAADLHIDHKESMMLGSVHLIWATPNT